MVSPYLFQSEMSNVTPELNNTDKHIRANLVQKIATQLIESKINKMEDYLMVKLINILMMQNVFVLPYLVI